MINLFLEMTKQGLPHCSVSGDYELMNIFRVRYEKPPSFDETKDMATQTLEGLEFCLAVRSFAGEMSQVGDFFLELRDQNHFMILIQREDLYAAVISIGWRGNPLVDQDRREKYLAFLQKYFRASES